MPTGLSLHIGLNRVDPNHYGGWDGKLAGCINDADDMQAIAAGLGYTTTRLVDEKATVRAVSSAVKKAAGKLSAGDTFLLTYSGHGGQLPDRNGDERLRDTGEVGETQDAYDETWVLYDRQLVDDELYALWAEFAPKTRLVVLSDSCHSGTVTRLGPPRRGDEEQPTWRRVPLDVEERTYEQNKALYDRVQKRVPPREASTVKATVALISGCMDNQLSADGAGNGLFTSRLLEVWDGGAFRGSLRSLRARVAALMPDRQTPNYYVVGVSNRPFLRRPALRI